MEQCDLTIMGVFNSIFFITTDFSRVRSNVYRIGQDWL